MFMWITHDLKGPICGSDEFPSCSITACYGWPRLGVSRLSEDEIFNAFDVSHKCKYSPLLVLCFWICGALVEDSAPPSVLWKHSCGNACWESPLTRHTAVHNRVWARAVISFTFCITGFGKLQVLLTSTVFQMNYITSNVILLLYPLKGLSKYCFALLQTCVATFLSLAADIG